MTLSSLVFEKADLSVRETLHSTRALYWAKDLTPDQFKERNRRLYACPFSDGIATYILKNSGGKICASLDSLSVSFLVKEGERLEKKMGTFLAFVVVNPEIQGKGFGGQLLSRYFSEVQPPLTFLFSDVGAPFYEKFGFLALPEENCSVAAKAVSPRKIEGHAVTNEAMMEAVLADRHQKLLSARETLAAWLAPDSAFLFWRQEYYRAKAWAAGRSVPESLCWKLNHAETPHWLALAPDYVADRLDILYATHDCPECLQFSQATAAQWGVRSVRYWRPATAMSAADSVEWPMLRVHGGRPPALKNSQIGDWW